MTGLTDEEEFLQRSLADLEAEHAAGDIDESDYETLKRRYTNRYETVERELRAGPVKVADPEIEPDPGGAFAVIVTVYFFRGC